MGEAASTRTGALHVTWKQETPDGRILRLAVSCADTDQAGTAIAVLQGRRGAAWVRLNVTGRNLPDIRRIMDWGTFMEAMDTNGRQEER